MRGIYRFKRLSEPQKSETDIMDTKDTNGGDSNGQAVSPFTLCSIKEVLVCDDAEAQYAHLLNMIRHAYKY